MRPRYFQFRLRTLLLATTIIGAFAGILGTQIRGRIQTEYDPPYFTDYQWSSIHLSSGPGPTIVLICKSEDAAKKLAEQFDRNQFISDLQLISASKPEMGHHALEAISVNTITINEFVGLKYDFPRWGRYQLDVRRMTYVFDLNDPIAVSRNAQVHDVFTQTAEAFAQRNPNDIRLSRDHILIPYSPNP